MCGWAAFRLSVVGGDDGQKLRKAALAAAQNLGTLEENELKSPTFEERVFLHAQVLRLLASQARYQDPLFDEVFKKVRETIANHDQIDDKPNESTATFKESAAKTRETIANPGVPAATTSGHGPDEVADTRSKTPTKRRRLHPFYLHYCVLAMEEVRRPALDVVSKIEMIREWAGKLATQKSNNNDFSSLVSSLELAGRLRDALESLGTVVLIKLKEPALGQALDDLAVRMKVVIQDLTTALRKAGQPTTTQQLENIVNESLDKSAKVLRTLPQAITRISPDEQNVSIDDTLNLVNNEVWYEETFQARLREEVINQISYASSSERSRLDVGALAYSLSAITQSDLFYLPPAIAKKALQIVMEYERGGRWNAVQPIATKDVGFAHFPLNIEIGNALLAIMRQIVTDRNPPWKQIDDVMDWVSDTVNKVYNYQGWCNEHNYSPHRIDLYVTAQVAQFLLDYEDIRSRLVIGSALERAGIAAKSPLSIKMTWEKLAATDLEVTVHDKQIKNKLKDAFVTPYERGQERKSSSVLLYGPPGTSKTSIMEALAHRLGWRFLQISPADFLSTGGENVEARATLLFEILRRSKNLVILFDEVDELLLDREMKDRPTGIFRFMTTSMLPKLQSLKSRGAVIFGIATNYKERLDRAITRQGRVDHDWAVLPPDFTSRIVIITEILKRPHMSAIRLDVRKFAANTAFFSYPELEKAISSGYQDDPWEGVRHPTAGPEAYINRMESTEEFMVLLNSQVTDSVIKLAEAATKLGLGKQLKELADKLGKLDEKKEADDEQKDLVRIIRDKISKLTDGVNSGQEA
jgi:DNA polymerase III delta prime subunit